MLFVRLLALALCALCTAAQAQEWPSKPVKIVVPFAPGGSSDALTRLIAPELSIAFKQQFYVENRAGSSGAVGSAQVARSEPDGYTLVNAGSGPHLTGPAINPNIGYDPLKDFTHIAMVAADGFVLVANPDLGAKSLDDLVRIARTRQVTSGSPGPGSLGHLILEQFKRKAGVDIQHVPSPGSGMNDILGNHISLTMTTLLNTGPHIRAGKIIALGVTSEQRNPVYTEIPTFAEQGFPEVRGETWFWLAGPKGLSPVVVDRLNREVRRIMKTPKMQEHLNGLALLTRDLDPDSVTKFVADEYAYWGPLARDVGLKVQ
jgi:tripartite-type tricarboxylate transporter receptor subunit TctC